jgi:hypothetical protein
LLQFPPVSQQPVHCGQGTLAPEDEDVTVDVELVVDFDVDDDTDEVELLPRDAVLPEPAVVDAVPVVAPVLPLAAPVDEPGTPLLPYPVCVVAPTVAPELVVGGTISEPPAALSSSPGSAAHDAQRTAPSRDAIKTAVVVRDGARTRSSSRRAHRRMRRRSTRGRYEAMVGSSSGLTT